MVNEAPNQLSADVAPRQVMELDDEEIVKRLRFPIEGAELQSKRGNMFRVVKSPVVEISAVERKPRGNGVVVDDATSIRRKFLRAD